MALSLTQPVDLDLARSCVYVNEGSSYPELQTDTDGYPLVNGCLQINTMLTPQARLIPDSDGIFTTSELSSGSSTSFWHDSMTVENPGIPSLAENGTFSYRDVAIDMCDNTSGITEAQAVTVLCGEDPKIADFTTNSINHPKPRPLRFRKSGHAHLLSHSHGRRYRAIPVLRRARRTPMTLRVTGSPGAPHPTFRAATSC